MSDFGTVAEVSIVTLGDELAADVSIGASSLTVVDPADFSEGGGTLQVGSEIVVYTACDDETGIITLASTLTAAHVAADRVDRYPIGQQKWAMVALGDDTEAITALVPHSLWDKLTEGIRTGTGEQVVVEEVRNESWEITDILGAIPLIDAGLLDPGSTGDPLSLSDGLAPVASAVPTVTGLPRIIMAQIDGVVNHDPVTYEWHISTSTAAPTFGGATGHHADGGTLTTFSTDATGAPLAYDVVYYIGVFAFDIDVGTAGASAFSGWSAGVSLNPNGTADIAVEAIKAAQIDVVDLLANGIRTADAGQRVTLSTAEGFAVIDSAENVRVSFPTASDEPLKVNADLITASLEASGLTIREQDNVLAKESVLTLESTISTPLGTPTVAIGWPTVALTTDVSRAIDYRRGLHFYSSKWWLGHRDTASNTGFLAAYNTNGTDAAGGFDLPALMQPDGGICHLVIAAAQRWAVLCKKTSDDTWWVVILDDTGTEISRWWWSDGDTGQGAAIASEGTSSILIAQRDTGVNYIVRSYVASSGASNFATTCTATIGSPGGSEVNGLVVSSADFGAARYSISLKADARVRVFNTSGTEQSNVSFVPANGERVAGLAWDGTNFYTASRGSSGLHKYSDIFKNTATLAAWPAYTWYDSDATGGTHETAMSTQIKKTIDRRQSITVTTPDIPDAGGTDDPDSVKIYIGYNATTPARTAMWLHASPAAGVRTATISAQLGSGTNPPAASNFPAATPAKIVDSAGAELLTGSSAWTPYTPVWTAATTNPTVGNGSLTGSWKRIGNTIFCKIKLVLGSTSTVGSGAYRWSLPVAAISGVDDTLGACLYSDASGLKYACVAGVVTTTTINGWLGTGGAFTSTNPVVPANGDIYTFALVYEAA